MNALEGERITAYGAPGGRDRDAVLSLHEEREGGLWIGLDFDGGLNRLWEGQRHAVPKPDGFREAAIRVIHQDRRGSLWIGTSRGLNVWEGSKCVAYTATNGLPGETVLALCEDETGALWVGTEGGLSRWNGERFINFTTREGLSHNTVNALYADRHQTLWIGTKGGGLNWWKAGRFSACTTKEGLFSDEIYEVLEDDFGYLWLSCRKGIFRVARKELEELEHGALPRVTCIAFGKADGMGSVQCNGVAKPAGWKGRDGRLWFPTIRGVVAVEPRIKPNDKPPPVSIEEVLVDKRSWREFGRDALGGGGFSLDTPAGSLTVPPGRGELEIHYTALSLQVPEKNRFKYLLEGVDSGWIEAGSERVARYNNLAPGHYRFRVTGCNNDGVWNATGASLGLVLQPYSWQTWWFKAAIVTALGLVLGLFYRFRVTRLREIERLRIEIAANLHDDLGSRLTKVTMMAEVAERQSSASDPLKPQIESISRTTREIVQAMDEIVWTINPKNDSLDNLANYIFQY
ncbi:MAG TPA: two-component regulator propeller domain-containing protein, partial [Candidatus Sulfotelmatobacter sp.]|nr:two-component regulator propeller domain-containing protein [Candidatus Sulfotelmatobacter sp.]